jgi:hypothetical protein
MSIVMKIVGLADGRPDASEGQYVQRMDFETGDLCTCRRAEEALRFDDVEVLLNYWMTQSCTVPLRDDGKPNRPLTAFTIETELVP